jgi:hypothetical protein
MKHTQKVVIIPIEKYERMEAKINSMEQLSPTSNSNHSESKQVEVNREDSKPNIANPDESVDSTEVTSLPKIQTSNEKEQEWVQYFPKKQQFKASLIFKYIKHNAVLGWDSLGELTVKGNSVKGSHIVDLVKDILSSKKHNKLIGFNEFYSNLQNIPISLVKNKARIVLLQEGKGVKIDTPPPGISNSAPISLENYYKKKAKKKEEEKITTKPTIQWKKLY